MRKTLVTFTIAISLGFSGTIANAQEAAPAGPAAQVADSTVVAEAEAAPAPADAATINNTEAITEATTAAESEAAEPANAEADRQPKPKGQLQSDAQNRWHHRWRRQPVGPHWWRHFLGHPTKPHQHPGPARVAQPQPSTRPGSPREILSQLQGGMG